MNGTHSVAGTNTLFGGKPDMAARASNRIKDPLPKMLKQSFRTKGSSAQTGLRALNQVEQATLASAEGNVAQQAGLIFSPGLEASWDAGGVSNPVVRYFRTDETERWMMWYNGYSLDAAAQSPPAPSIGAAVSSDGLHWERTSQSSAAMHSNSDLGKVMGGNEDWWWHDTRHVSVSDVQMFSSDAVSTGEGVYWMYYTGGSFEEAEVPAKMPGLPGGQTLEGIRTRAGLALSQDGFNFARIEADHHSGALFDVGAEEDWDRTCNSSPQVLTFGATDRKMYYSAYNADSAKWTVGLATSKDGFTWRKQGPIFEGGTGNDFDAQGAISHHVVRDVDSKRFVMFYEGVSNDNQRSISLAVSKDGISGWKRFGRAILSAGNEANWDSAGVGTPCPVSMAGGRWRLYYTGWRGDGKMGIGLAITDKDDLSSFEGVRVAFKRRA